MNYEADRLNKVIQDSRKIYSLQSQIWSPYFNDHIFLTSDGLNHLQYKNNRTPRNTREQLLKLLLLPRALEVIKKAGTLQEYRRSLEKIGNPQRDGFYKTKQIEYWGFHSIFGENNLRKIVVILKRVGDGKVIFWSVMPHRKFNNPKLYDDGIEDF